MKAKYSSKICILIILVVAILSLSNNVFAATITKEKLQENMNAYVTGKKKATVKWSKVTGATGYEIYMSTKKSSGYKKVGTNTKNNKISYTKTKIKRKKKYYFKVRTYRIVNGKKVYSSYSNVKYVKVK